MFRAFNDIFPRQIHCALPELNILKSSWVVLGSGARAGPGLRILRLELDFVKCRWKKINL